MDLTPEEQAMLRGDRGEAGEVFYITGVDGSTLHVAKRKPA